MFEVIYACKHNILFMFLKGQKKMKEKEWIWIKLNEVKLRHYKLIVWTNLNEKVSKMNEYDWKRMKLNKIECIWIKVKKTEQNRSKMNECECKWMIWTES